MSCSRCEPWNASSLHWGIPLSATVPAGAGPTSRFPILLRCLHRLLGLRKEQQSLQTGVERGRCKRLTPTHPQRPPRRSGAGVCAPPRGGAGPSSPRPQRAGLQRLQRLQQAGGRDVPPQGGLQDPGAAAEGAPQPRAAAEGRWVPGAGPHEHGSFVRGSRGWAPLCTCLPRVGQARVVGWGSGEAMGEGRRVRCPEVLGEFESREPFQRGFWNPTWRSGFKSCCWPSALASVSSFVHGDYNRVSVG